MYIIVWIKILLLFFSIEGELSKNVFRFQEESFGKCVLIFLINCKSLLVAKWFTTPKTWFTILFRFSILYICPQQTILLPTDTD
jgi:hypothetical protein